MKLQLTNITGQKVRIEIMKTNIEGGWQYSTFSTVLCIADKEWNVRINGLI